MAQQIYEGRACEFNEQNEKKATCRKVQGNFDAYSINTRSDLLGRMQDCELARQARFEIHCNIVGGLSMVPHSMLMHA